jgi:hypothetical protein
MSLSRQFMRHLRVWGVAFLVTLLIWIVEYWHTYIGPSASASPDNHRFAIGSAIALVITTTVLTTIMLPSILCAAVARRLLNLPRWTELIIAVIGGSAFSVGLQIWYIEALTTHPPPPLTEMIRGYGIYLATPLGLYWFFTRHWRQASEPKDATR